MPEQIPLDRDAIAAGIPADAACAYHTMARDQDGKPVAGICLTYRAGRTAHLGGDDAVGCRAAEGNGRDLVPDPSLVGGSARIERQLEPPQPAIEIGMKLFARVEEEGGCGLIATPAPIDGDDPTALFGNGQRSDRRVDRKLRHLFLDLNGRSICGLRRLSRPCSPHHSKQHPPAQGDIEDRVIEADTIFALASGAGRGAIAVIRISGSDAGTILRRIAPPMPPPRRASVRPIRTAEGEVLDHALILWFPAPRSYTGEDMAELHVHAGQAVISAVLELLSGSGARQAEAGEFTRRAFLAGRLDLLQAEGVADLIDAETQTQRRQALAQAGGQLSAVHQRWSMSIRHLLALQEASIDFPDEADDGATQEEGARLAGDLREELLRHLEGGKRAETLRRGVVIAVTGAPNVGKSSLVNALASRDVSIVSPRPGTTRDVVEARIVLADVPVTLLDTAGLRDTDDEIEREGVERALRAAAAAEITVEVIESGRTAAGHASLVVANKVDLHPAPPGVLGVSARTGAGLDALRTALAKLVGEVVLTGTDPVVTRARHRDCIARCVDHLERASLLSLPELRGEEYRLASHSLGRLTGTVTVDDILGDIFSTFCIGK